MLKVNPGVYKSKHGLKSFSTYLKQPDLQETFAKVKQHEYSLNQAGIDGF